MGYSISAHIVKSKPEVGKLTSLPQSIGYRWYKNKSFDLYAMDTFSPARSAEYPFQSRLPTKDVSLEMPPGLEVLTALHNALTKLQLANGFSRGYISFSLNLSKLLSTPILSIVSDDDSTDFACTAANGTLTRINCRCEDLQIGYSDGQLRIQPLVPESDEDEDCLTDLEMLKSLLPDVPIEERTTLWNAELHALASEEWKLFTGGVDQEMLGLGTFDPEYEPHWEVIASQV